MLKYNKDLKQYSRELRRNMTDAEKLLWSKIRDSYMGDINLKVLRFSDEDILKDINGVLEKIWCEL